VLRRKKRSGLFGQRTGRTNEGQTEQCERTSGCDGSLNGSAVGLLNDSAGGRNRVSDTTGAAVFGQAESSVGQLVGLTEFPNGTVVNDRAVVQVNCSGCEARKAHTIGVHCKTVIWIKVTVFRGAARFGSDLLISCADFYYGYGFMV
jgi:hypothetical protein